MASNLEITDDIAPNPKQSSIGCARGGIKVAPVGPHPSGSRPHPQRDESHTVLPPAGGDEARAGGRYGDCPEDAESHLLDTQERRAPPPRAGRGGSGGRKPGGLTLKQM